MHVKDLHITIVGAARSGVAAARLLSSKGAKVFVSDAGEIGDSVREQLNSAGIPFEAGQHSPRAYECTMAVVSPGVPDHAPLIRHFTEHQTPVYSEIEVASWFSHGPVVAITGSNGKTTVTSWLSHVWKTASKPHVTAGNIGLAFSDVVSSATPAHWALLEVSSFQLDHIDRFRPNISCILNITPDHLDRYQNRFDLYAASKMRILKNQREGDVFICWSEDSVTNHLLETTDFSGGRPAIWKFSSEKKVDNGIYVHDGNIIFNIHNREEYLMHVSEIGLQGRHNLHNGLATALAARAAEIRVEYIRESLMKFEGVEHRLELVRELKGVRYVNDSKATNVNAVWYALDSFHSPLVLIMGGRDKGNDYTEIIPQLREKVHTLIAIGESTEKISMELGGIVPHFKPAESMNDAVRLASKSARRGETVLLSPACASFDMFENYEDRGRAFKRAVFNLD